MLSATHTRQVVPALLALICTLAPLCVRAQTSAKETRETSTVAGRVMLEGHGAAGLPVLLAPYERSRDMKPGVKATTDADGRYRLTDVPPGRYLLNPTAPAYVVSGVDTSSWQPGRLLNVMPGDQLEGLDFTLTRGGVITGRVRDADGHPVIETMVRIMAADEAERNKPQFNPPHFTFQTDDRGIYRFYGLSPGRYLVFVGESPEDGIVRGGGAGALYPRTFYGNTVEQAQAKPVEITTGEEATGIDITVGKPTRTYEATGRVVDERGRPVAGATVAHGPLSADGQQFNGGFGTDGSRTSERGEFRVRGLPSGRHAVFAAQGTYANAEQTSTYSDPVAFEIVEQDVSGLEIKLTRGATVTGMLVIEGTSNPAVLARRTELHLGASVQVPAGLAPPNETRAQVRGDGSFQITGVRPGRAMFYLSWPQLKGFTLVRVQRDGLDQPEGFEIKPGEQVTGVRVVVSYGASTLRGQVQTPDGALPEGTRFYVEARRAGMSTGNILYANVDTFGRFVFENLAAGEYELVPQGIYPPGNGRAQQRTSAERKFVNVPENSETQVTLVFRPEPPQ